MRKVVVVVLMIALAAGGALQASQMKKAFKQADRIVRSIERTKFPKRTFVITDFGAVANDEQVLNHEAINNAIIACNQAGGGTVVVPAGTFHTGPLRMKSNVNLHVSEGATLQFTTDESYYYPAVLTRWEGIDCYNAHPLIYAYGETNIALTGKGVLDGQGAADKWWYMKGGGYSIPGMPDQITSGGRDRLFAAAENGEPVDRRVMRPEEALRPPFVNFIHCNRVLIEDLTIRNSPFWVLHPMFCSNVIVRGVDIQSHGPNSDGLDPESCRNVLIENCVFNTGDDCIAIKSGRNNDGRRWNVPSENIVVRNCKMNDGHGGVVIGSEISGGFKNLFVENCIMDSPNLDRAIRIKTSNCRGGTIENIFVRNIQVGEVKEAVLRINLVYEPREVCDRSFDPVVRNVHMENVQSGKSRYGVLLNGLETSANIQNITLTNCSFENVSSGANRFTGKTGGVHFENVRINSKEVQTDGQMKP